MTSSQIIDAVIAAVLLFWAVGAYNRLVRLRGAIVRRFVPVDEQFRLRHALLIELVDTLGTLLNHAGPRIEALRAACLQVEAACAHARQRPGASGAITSLRLADSILAEARAKLPVQSAPGSDLALLGARLQASDAMLAFARQQFDEAVSEYNRAVRQFPTLLLVGLFGFRTAALL
ncbi:MAG: LemA family protein [Pseudomonadota bacterium]|nr:LemA family protein [Pseudomonadota bacterium]